MMRGDHRINIFKMYFLISTRRRNGNPAIHTE
jgi:hypothetical protein